MFIKICDLLKIKNKSALLRSSLRYELRKGKAVGSPQFVDLFRNLFVRFNNDKHLNF